MLVLFAGLIVGIVLMKSPPSAPPTPASLNPTIILLPNGTTVSNGITDGTTAATQNVAQGTGQSKSRRVTSNQPPREEERIHRNQKVEITIAAATQNVPTQSKLIVLDQDSQRTTLTAGTEDITVCLVGGRKIFLGARESMDIAANQFWFENSGDRDAMVTVKEY